MTIALARSAESADYLGIWKNQPRSSDPLEPASVDLGFLQKAARDDETFAGLRHHYQRPHPRPTTYNLNLSRDDISHLDYQSHEAFEWFASHPYPRIQHHIIESENAAPVFPTMFARQFFWMCFLDGMDFLRLSTDRYVFLTREELITPHQEMRSGLWMHTDQNLVLPDGTNLGPIRRAWNIYNRIPTFGYAGNLTNVDIPEFKEQVWERLIMNEGEGGTERVLDYLGEIGALFKTYGEKVITGFMGGDKGWLHMAQPIIGSHYLRGNDFNFDYEFQKHMNGWYREITSDYAEVTQPFIRNMATLFVVGPTPKLDL